MKALYFFDQWLQQRRMNKNRQHKLKIKVVEYIQCTVKELKEIINLLNKKDHNLVI